ncbi:hypothetical protein V498_09068 [Pseudogymnoascus sp. VKM F-4517 (FW-2822)]|nr:hypothetical protein V498_09068 [Pseudogymnoascus sp. VKM F-4517 (FW-2822)]
MPSKRSSSSRRQQQKDSQPAAKKHKTNSSKYSKNQDTAMMPISATGEEMATFKTLPITLLSGFLVILPS